MADGTCVFDNQVLSLVLGLFAPKELARAQAVSKQFRDVAQDPGVQRASFVSYWKILNVLGEPRQRSFFGAATLKNFAYKHDVRKGDTLPMLAVKYGVDVTTIKRANNFISDHSLFSRYSLYIPVPSAATLEGRYISFEYCPNASRDFAVVHDSEPADFVPQPHRNSKQEVAQLAGKLSSLLGRSLRVDENTAKYYVNLANGNLKEAIKHWEQDNAWEGQFSSGRERAAIQSMAQKYTMTEFIQS